MRTNDEWVFKVKIIPFFLFLYFVHLVFFAEKMEYFLDLSSNSLVREQAMQYVEHMSNVFIK